MCRADERDYVEQEADDGVLLEVWGVPEKKNDANFLERHPFIYVVERKKYRFEHAKYSLHEKYTRGLH